VLQRADRHDARHVTAERCGEDRFANPEVAHVAYDEEVAVEQLGVGLDERLEVALRLLHAFEDQLDGAGGPAVEDTHRAHVSDESADIV